jgi:hypothetical protein
MVPKCLAIAVLNEAMAACTPLMSASRHGFHLSGELGQSHSLQDFSRMQFASRGRAYNRLTVQNLGRRVY